MLPPYLPSDETRRAYHSGLSGKVFDPADLIRPEDRGKRDRTVVFQTAKYGPPYRVSIRTDVSQWKTEHEGEFADGSWRFTLPGRAFPGPIQLRLVLHRPEGGRGEFTMVGPDVGVEEYEASRRFTDTQVLFAYEVSFQTDLWQPNHLVTLRNSEDGWSREVYGSFRNNCWNFWLDADIYPDAFEAKLVLDGTLFMHGGNLQLAAAQPILQLDDTKVVFSATPTAFRHGYDNFSSVTNPLEQLTVRATGREDDAHDVIIIGSGMGGGILADALSDRGIKVLVLEAGGLRFPAHINELPRTEVDLADRDKLGHFVIANPQTNAYFGSGVHFNLGGRSVYWSGLIPRMQEWELRPVWPESVRNYLTQAPPGGMSGYERAERVMRKIKTLGPFQDALLDHLNLKLGPHFIATDLPRSMHQPDFDAQGNLQNVVQRSTGGFSTADLLLDSLGFTNPAGRNNLRVNLHHLVKYIEKDDSRATAVVCEDLVGRVERRYSATNIVLACGSIESPKLALNSELVDPNGKIGIGLTDHPAYFYQKDHALPISGPLGWIGDPSGHAKLILRHKQATSLQHAYHIELLVNARFWDTRHSDDDLWNQVVGNPDPSRVEIKFIFDSPIDDRNSVQANGVGQKVDVHVEPNLTANCYKAEMVEVRNSVLTALGVTDELTAHWDDWEWSQGVYGTVHHAGGTLRMCADGTGVVDEDLKFLNYDNLYCCDISVFPSIPAANPSLTLAALALRLADKLSATGPGVVV